MATGYKSDKLISFIEKEIGSKLSSAKRHAIQKEMRKYFINIHREAVDATIIAKNKPTVFIYPQFED